MLERDMSGRNRRAVVCHLGRVEYRPAWNLQRTIQEALIDAKRANPNHRRPHVVLTVEHPPVYTLGKSGDRGNLLATPDQLAASGATYVEIDRGGDITFHGPGQLVVYPILDLGHLFTDIHRYLRTLEEIVILTCRAYGVQAGRSPGRTGVWVGPDERGAERKICAMGIKCSRWVTSHGLALNVRTDLDYFQNIIPCGIADRSVTSLAAEIGKQVDIVDVLPVLTRHFGEALDLQIDEFDGGAAIRYLRDRFPAIGSAGQLLSEDTPKSLTP